MSSVTTSKVDTINGTTDLTLTTGNTAGPKIIVKTVGTDGVILGPNSTVNSFSITQSGINFSANVTSTANINITGRLSTTTNVITNTVIANTISVVNATISTNTFTFGASSLAANGYTRLPNGLLLQWGTQSASVNSSTTATANFPAAFGTLYSVTATTANASASGTSVAPAVVNTYSTTAFTWKTTFGTTATSTRIFYMAIGT